MLVDIIKVENLSNQKFLQYFLSFSWKSAHTLAVAIENNQCVSM